jgi:hypothetical protein
MGITKRKKKKKEKKVSHKWQTQHYSKLIMCKENNQSKAREQINHLQMYVLTKHSK